MKNIQLKREKDMTIQCGGVCACEKGNNQDKTNVKIKYLKVNLKALSNSLIIVINKKNYII